MFKTEKDFGGYWVKNIKEFKGHEQEPLWQASVYKNGKKIGFFSEDSRGGPARLDCNTREQEKELMDFAREFLGEEAWAESYHTFLSKIAEETDYIKQVKKLCKNKILIQTPEEIYDYLENALPEGYVCQDCDEIITPESLADAYINKIGNFMDLAPVYTEDSDLICHKCYKKRQSEKR